MPQKPSVYRSFVTCSDPEGVVICGTVRKERTNYMPENMDMSCSGRGLRDERVVGNLSNSSSQLQEIEKGAQKLNKMIDSWVSGMGTHGEPKDNIAKDLLRGALDLQQSLNMLSKLQEATLYMTKLKRLEKLDEKERIYVDGLNRSVCADEVKKRIRDSPVTQNLLPVSYLEHRWDRRGKSCASEGQSTSSGQSSVNISKTACSTDNSSVSSDYSDKNRKRTNVIAKLMGLDDSKPVQATTSSTTSEVLDEKRIRPAFDFEMPESKKPHISTGTRYQEKKTLRELMEATQSKSDLGNKFVDRLVPRTILKSRDDDADKFPPIVLMKPLRIPYKEFEKGHERRLDASEVVNELKGKNWFSQMQDRVFERASLMKNEKNSTCTPQISTPETSKPPESAVAKLQITKTKIKEKTFVSTEQTSRANRTSVKSPDVSNSIKRVSNEKKVSRTKLLPKEPPVSPSKSSNQDKNLSIRKTQTSVPRKLSQTTTSDFTKKTSTDYSVNVKRTQKKKGKPATRPISANALRHEDDATDVDLSCQIIPHAVPARVATKTITETSNKESWRDVQVMHGNGNGVQEQESDKNFKDVECERVTTNMSFLKSRSFRQNVLMSSPTFAASVEVLFHLKISSTSSKDARPSIHMDDDTSLFISYAKEVLERRSNHLLFSSTSTSIPVSVNQLLEEVGDAYTAIDSYKDGIPTADIFDMLDRDMKCKEVVSSVWDLGWRNGHSAVETNQIVASLEKLILRDFIDEIFVH